MTHALNLTLPIKQDAETLAKLRNLEASFTEKVQPAIAAALKQSRIVHFARVVVIDDKYIQVITEYEGTHQEYAEFSEERSRRYLPRYFPWQIRLAWTSTIPMRSSNSRRTTTHVRWARRPTARPTSAATRPAGCSRLTTA
ncbi:hypothetical protein ACQ5SK_43265 [Bradyrhizobium japonicum]